VGFGAGADEQQVPFGDDKQEKQRQVRRQLQKPMRGFFPFGYAQGQNDGLGRVRLLVDGVSSRVGQLLAVRGLEVAGRFVVVVRVW
jgi:hypothetical protein